MAIDPSTDPYILSGRVVTMGAAGVIDPGHIYIRDRHVEAVDPSGAPRPAGFEQAPIVATGDTLYPGLIELHNHLAYNAMPLWDVPTRYSNNGQWRGLDPYKRRITKPSQVLGRSAATAPSLIRYVECRALLGGVTTSQGITLAGSGIARYYRGLVRNVEQPLDPRLPAASTNIANPTTGGAEAYRDRLGAQSCYLQHLSEGTDATARSWFLRLRLPDGSWAVTPALCAIHGAALRAEDLAVLAAGGAGIVWSPLSNYLLYGATLDLGAARQAQVPLALGSDWAPSGSKSLLGELKVASLASELQGGVFGPEELVAMVTSTPARLAKWDHLLGTIEAGKLADIVAVDGRRGDPYRALIEARESSISLVVIDGVPRLGQPSLMDRFEGTAEAFEVGRSQRKLALADPQADELVGGLGLADAVAALSDGMARLPDLAAELDASRAAGSLGGVVDAAGTSWRIVPDLEADDLARGIDSAAEPLADWVEPMRLDPLTVVDDIGHLRSLMAARNLPEAIKDGLPALHGRTRREVEPLPEGAEFVADPHAKIAGIVRETTGDLWDFLRSFGELTLADRMQIVDEAELVLAENYVHLSLKRAMHAVDPIQQLRLLRRRLERLAESDRPDGADPPLPPEIEFHAELSDIFNGLRDLHTTYQLPMPFASRVAWLPYLVEACVDAGERRYIVTRVVPGAGPADFVPGVEVTHWNGMSIGVAVARNAERSAGSNPDARFARGLHSLTIRPLGHGVPPDEEWVTLRYRRPGIADPAEYTQRWLVFQPGAAGSVGPGLLDQAASAIGLDARTDAVQQVRKTLYAPDVAEAEERARGQELAATFRNAAAGLETTMPGVFRATVVRSADGTEYGWLRIFTFNVADDDSFVAEFVRLLESLPGSGLVIDVRGNGGGNIYAAERILQTLGPRRIEPERAQFATTPLNLRICRAHQPSATFPDLDLGPWVASMADAVTTGAGYSAGFPITPETACNDIGQRYGGPVVLVTDALCYSATDMFAAGFQDHAIGPVIGVGGATGAGGANVWSHALLMMLTEADGATSGPSPYRLLPGGADLRVAMRRTLRTGDGAGDILEDLGVRPQIPYAMTRADLLESNRDLQQRAVAALATGRVHGLRVTLRARAGRLPLVALRTTRIDRIDVSARPIAIDGRVESWPDARQLGSRDVQGGRVTLDPEPIAEVGPGGVELEIRAYDGPDLVIRRLDRLAIG